MPEGTVTVGRVGRSHGLRGLFRVRIDHPHGAALLAGAERVWIDGLGEARVDAFVPHGRDWLLSVDRVRRIETAQRLLHADVRARVPASPSPGAADPVEDDDAYPATVRTGVPVLHDGRTLGTVVATCGSPLQPLLRIALEGGTDERYLPAQAPYVQVHDDAVRLIDPPPGLLDDA
ncbi:MAG: hypothetical protein WD336_04160 [Trueperaceae bacterium]